VRDEIARACAILGSGGLVAFPTETVYGLGADAENPEAVASIFRVKGRPTNHPVIVHVAPEADIEYWAHSIPSEARSLMDAFWPGPLTLILPRAPHVPPSVSGGQDTLGLRCPSHPVAVELLRAFKGGKGGVAAPSANKFGHVSPTTAEHVRQEFALELGNSLGLVLDGGSSAVGIESTIIDMSRMATHGPVLLRPGFITAEDIESVIGRAPGAADSGAPRASGTLSSHYAPATPALLCSPELLKARAEILRVKNLPFALLLHSMENLSGAAATIRLPSDPELYARGLYASLRSLDKSGAYAILVETPPSEPAWDGVRDRLTRAAFGSESALDGL
jgi:L-threonylcarbamoyladenylate synthase